MLDLAELGNLTEYSKLFIALLAISNPLAGAVAVMAFMASRPSADPRRIALVAATAVAVALLVVALVGDLVLTLFGITLDAFRVGGGLLLLLGALEMMRPKANSNAAIPAEASIVSFAVVPIAIPLLAGPGAISSVIVFSGLHEGASHRLLVMAVIVAVALILYLVLRAAPTVSRLIGTTGIAVFERVMGLIIAAIGVEFILDGIAGHFPQLEIVHL